MYVFSLLGVGEIAGSPIMGSVKDIMGARLAIFI